ncbi:hypothetical protein USDA257_c40560 [Sinorhizobium fredii USDA 257]|uniref:Uncharacterized protein n=1 Tax=Sinorhizobium fredii (strain USDA 257) TaxID=1185652 RepID=I3X9P3_SINF2|nr:hypothetical protein USDA257_c40560 [Sinorhizobium fredii USDA 257]
MHAVDNPMEGKSKVCQFWAVEGAFRAGEFLRLVLEHVEN